MYGILLFLHILSATIWTGGHIVLSTIVLPKVLRSRSPQMLLEFESSFEKIGMPALVIQIVTGLLLIYRLQPIPTEWFNTSVSLSHPILAKLTLLTLTFCLAINARFRVLPSLSSRNLNVMAAHIISVTLLSILFVFVGVSFRTGWMY